MYICNRLVISILDEVLSVYGGKHKATCLEQWLGISMSVDHRYYQLRIPSGVQIH